MTLQAMQAQLDACCRRQYVKPEKTLTGLEKQWQEQSLDEITRDYEEMFKK